MRWEHQFAAEAEVTPWQGMGLSSDRFDGAFASAMNEQPDKYKSYQNDMNNVS